MNVNMADKIKVGHRQRLRNRFMAGEEISRTDEALLELLLSYAIPQKDVQTLAKKLIAEFGNLADVLAANADTLCKFDGIKSHSVVLLKLAHWIRTHYATKRTRQADLSQPEAIQSTLFDLPTPDKKKLFTMKEVKAKPRKSIVLRRGTEMFGKAVLKEAIELLPRLPWTESLDEVREFLRSNLHFSAEQTRQRYTNYIIRRMFPDGYADQALQTFATKYAGHQEFQDVCFYRFCKAEPLMLSVVEDLLLPAIGIGRLNRGRLRDYLTQRFPSAKSIKDCGKAIVEAFVAGGIAKADRIRITFAYREVLIPSFAFVIHSEFPKPGMYDISKIESNQAMRAMLWKPDRILPSLYELRNQGIITKVSEIDNIRQFTTKWDLAQMVEELGIAGERA